MSFQRSLLFLAGIVFLCGLALWMWARVFAM